MEVPTSKVHTYSNKILTLGNYGQPYSGKAATKKPKLFSAKIHFLDLIRAGIQYAVPYKMDFFVTIAQWLKRKGFKGNCTNETVFSFFMDALFSVGCNLNGKNTELRKTLDLFGEVQLKGLNFYRNYESMPLFNKEHFYLEGRNCTFLGSFQNDKLDVSYNPSHKDTVCIISKYIEIRENSFCYVVEYSDEKEYLQALNKQSCASWRFYIESNEGENYIDFCLRIYRNYGAIMRKDSRALKVTWKWNTYELMDNSKPIEGRFLKQHQWTFDQFSENENIGKLIDIVTGIHIEEFATVNMDIAIQTLQTATDLPFEFQFSIIKIKSGNRKGELKKITWYCKLLNDKVPTLLTVWYNYTDKEWNAAARALNDKGEIDKSCIYIGIDY
jgi:hypothetical protein